MPSLQALRRELRPFYGHCTDAVISMTGLEPNKIVRNALWEGHLGEVHAAQLFVKQRSARGLPPMAFTPYSQYLRWEKAPSREPRWFRKPVPKPPTKTPKAVSIDKYFYEAPLKDSEGYWEAILANQVIANVVFHIKKIGQRKVMVVRELQQHTNDRSPRSARKVEGWKHLAMRELEKMALEQNCKLILFSSGKPHAIGNVSAKPIHEEILHVYGRLPMQHGYKLKQLKTNLLGQNEERLWWVKRVK